MKDFLFQVAPILTAIATLIGVVWSNLKVRELHLIVNSRLTELLQSQAAVSNMRAEAALIAATIREDAARLQGASQERDHPSKGVE